MVAVKIAPARKLEHERPSAAIRSTYQGADRAPLPGRQDPEARKTVPGRACRPVRRGRRPPPPAPPPLRGDGRIVTVAAGCDVPFVVDLLSQPFLISYPRSTAMPTCGFPACWAPETAKLCAVGHPGTGALSAPRYPGRSRWPACRGRRCPPPVPLLNRQGESRPGALDFPDATKAAKSQLR